MTLNLNVGAPSATATGLTEGAAYGVTVSGGKVEIEVEVDTDVWTVVHRSNYGPAVIWPLPGTKIRCTLETGETGAVVAVTAAV